MTPQTLSYPDTDEYDRHWRFWVRGLLLAVVAGVGVVFAIAYYLNPYRDDGTARRMATHQQLGLPPCTFVDVTGIPCPACGMTTSFALLVRGDVANSLRANWVGTLLATFCALVVPWAVVSIVRGRPVAVRSLDRAVISVIITLLALMFLRWGVVVVLALTGWA